jgi:hypothetical protein
MVTVYKFSIFSQLNLNLFQLKNLIKICLLLLAIQVAPAAKATTWNEPWQDSVIKKADYFVLAKVVSFDEGKGVKINILKSFGSQLPESIEITDFYLLNLCSTSAGHGPEFHFDEVDSCYFFIKKEPGNKYSIATPTAGYAIVNNNKVAATYRHSYHQANVDVDIYEATMNSIFQNYHGRTFDEQYINSFVTKYLSLKPAGFDKSEINTFFNQHVALECIYHLRLKGYNDRLLVFLKDTSNMHTQISTARALIAYNSPETITALLNVIKQPGIDFVKVISVWTLASFKNTEVTKTLAAMRDLASTEETGFGGNIMDPRVCTYFPTVQETIDAVIKSK